MRFLTTWTWEAVWHASTVWMWTSFSRDHGSATQQLPETAVRHYRPKFNEMIIITLKTISSFSMFSWPLDIKTSTSWKGRRRNSSVFITSWKFSRANLWDLLCSSLQECVSAKFRIPRQFVGWSCRIRNLQQASLTELIWSMEDAGSRTWTLSSQIQISPT